jgi:ribosomal protein S12 methylthiotransferase
VAKVGFVSLGCPKALVDSERILTQMRLEGYEVVDSYDAADLVVVNTCGFIDSAVEESLDAIGEALAENGRVVVTGCLGERRETIEAAHPSVLAVTGAQAYEEVMEAVHQFAPPPATEHDPYLDLLPPQGVKLTPRHYAYLKISEGCNHKCSFCIIPSMRGRLRSRDVGDVLTEAERLVDAGVRELLVISQDTSAYGLDLKYRTGFWGGRPVKANMVELARSLGSLGAWVRLHYVYPYPHVDDVIPLMREGLVLPYLDIPFQHASPRILKLMRRPAAAEKVLERIQGWRELCPELVIRSTFIVGFPGETDEDFAALLDFLEAAKIDRAGCFTYSPVEGAAANALPNQVPADVARDREQTFMEVQAAVSAERLARHRGRTLRILVDETDAEEREGYPVIGRSYGDAPEIDGRVLVRDVAAETGEFVEVLIEDSDEHDLYGRPRR